MKNRLVTLLMPVMLVLLLFGCSAKIFRGREDGTPEAKAAVINVVNDYLRYVASGNLQQAEGMVVMIPYLENSGISKEEWRTAVEQLNKRWPLDNNHPLLALSVVNVEIRQDDAEVQLKKARSPKAPEIVLSLEWAGRGWLVNHDNLFGAEGIIAEYAKNQPPVPQNSN